MGDFPAVWMPTSICMRIFSAASVCPMAVSLSAMVFSSTRRASFAFRSCRDKQHLFCHSVLSASKDTFPFPNQISFLFILLPSGSHQIFSGQPPPAPSLHQLHQRVQLAPGSTSDGLLTTAMVPQHGQWCQSCQYTARPQTPVSFYPVLHVYNVYNAILDACTTTTTTQAMFLLHIPCQPWVGRKISFNSSTFNAKVPSLKLPG